MVYRFLRRGNHHWHWFDTSQMACLLTIDEIRTGSSYGEVSGYVAAPTGSAVAILLLGQQPDSRQLGGNRNFDQMVYRFQRWDCAGHGSCERHVYACQTVNGSSTARFDVTATVNTTRTPTVSCTHEPSRQRRPDDPA